jgi:hypothetical protein
MASHLKAYTDKTLSQLHKGLKFPRTEIGDSSDITIYLHNTSEKWPVLNIEHNKTHPDVTVQGIPQTLRPKESVPIKVLYRPSLKTDDPSTGFLDITSELHIG